MPSATDKVKCACSDCVCMVQPDTAVKRDGGLFCSRSCAEHHKDGSGCGHAGCACHG